MLENVLFGIEALSPIFFIIFLGWVLYNIGMINDNFVDVSSKLVMNVTFPILLILKISELDIQQTFHPKDIGIIYVVFFLIFAISWAFGKLIKIPQSEIGAFVQGSFRGNFGIIGLAVSANLYGKEGLALAALYLAFLMPLYNFLSIVALANGSGVKDKLSPVTFIKKIIFNPLLIAIIFGALLAILGISIPETLAKPADYVASITLPVALIGIGATLQFRNRDYSLSNTFFACVFKLALMPLLGILIAIQMEVTGVQLAVLFILFSMPTAIVTMPLAKSMGSDVKLASSIIVFSSIASIVTIALGLSILKSMYAI